ncbi:MAG: ribosome silencing factor [Dehalococcoidia bacterium]|nr:ribosome silencing factor [Dehalococcoidia bacterium]
MNSTEIAQAVVDMASDKLAEDIVMLDIRDLAWFADYFVIMSAQSTRQIISLEEDITKGLKENDVPRFHREGTSSSSWILLDFSGVIVHIFEPDTREMYGLERLWSGATEVVRIL